MRKKFILCAIVAALAASPIFGTVSFAEDAAYAAETGELSGLDIYINLDETGEWYGDYRFNKETGRITRVNEEFAGAAEIPSEIDGVAVKGISEGAFWFTEQLTSVTVPEGVEIIGRAAFMRCRELESVTLPSSVTEIGEYAFNACEKLASVNIPSGVKTIQTGCFRQCYALESIVLPDKVESIGPSAFENSAITDINNISDSVKEIGDSAFRGCDSLKEVRLNAVEKVGENSFLSCDGLEKAVIKSNITEIPAVMFGGCKNLKEVILPETVTTIGLGAFTQCALETVVLPEAVTSIGIEAFASCLNLKSIKLPDKLQSIERRAFYECTSLEAVEMPISLKSIGAEIVGDSEKPVTIYYKGTESDWNAIAIDARETTTGSMSVLFESSIPYSFEISGEPTDQNSTVLARENVSEITQCWVDVHKVDNSLNDMTMVMAEYDGNDRLIKANLLPVSFDENSSVSQIKMPVEFSSDLRKLVIYGMRDMKIVEPVMAQYYVFWVY